MLLLFSCQTQPIRTSIHTEIDKYDLYIVIKNHTENFINYTYKIRSYKNKFEYNEKNEITSISTSAPGIYGSIEIPPKMIVREKIPGWVKHIIPPPGDYYRTEIRVGDKKFNLKYNKKRTETGTLD